MAAPIELKTEDLGWMATSEQQKLGLSAYYDKRWMLPDGIHTEPIEFTMTCAGGSCVFGRTTNRSSRTNQTVKNVLV